MVIVVAFITCSLKMTSAIALEARSAVMKAAAVLSGARSLKRANSGDFKARSSAAAFIADCLRKATVVDFIARAPLVPMS